MFNSIKTQANVLGKVFEKHGIKMSRAQELEILAEIYGAKDYNELAVVTKPLAHAAKSLTNAAYRSEDQLRLNAPVDELALALMVNQESEKAVLFDQTQSLITRLLKSEVVKNHYELLPFEQSHAEDANDPQFGEELVLPTQSGFSLACAAQGEVDYLRVLNPQGEEIGYWTIDEFHEDASCVIGGVMGMLCRGDQRFVTNHKSIKDFVAPVVSFEVVENDGDGFLNFELVFADKLSKSPQAQVRVTIGAMFRTRNGKTTLDYEFEEVAYRKDEQELFDYCEPTAKQRRYLLDVLMDDRVANSIVNRFNALKVTQEWGVPMNAALFATEVDRFFGFN